MDYAEIVDADVRELRATCHLADCPDAGRGGLQPLVDLDVSPVGELNAGQLQAESFGVRIAACGEQYMMSKEDSDVCEALRSLLADEGIDILLNARIKQVSGKCGDSVSVVVEQNGIEKVLKGSHVLVATGRNPNTEGLGLELTGVDLTDRGYIKVNERLQTTAPGVWAIGEVAGSPQFTHISVDDFR